MKWKSFKYFRASRPRVGSPFGYFGKIKGLLPPSLIWMNDSYAFDDYDILSFRITEHLNFRQLWSDLPVFTFSRLTRSKNSISEVVFLISIYCMWPHSSWGILRSPFLTLVEIRFKKSLTPRVEATLSFVIFSSSILQQLMS